MDEILAGAKKGDVWVKIQRKTFTRWCNGYLEQRQMHIDNLEEGLKTGVALHAVLEIVSQETLRKVNTKARMPVQYIENVNTCLKYINNKGIKLVGIGAEDIHDGKTVLVLGLIWTLILRFQIVMDSTDAEMGLSFRDGLLAWCNRVLNPQGVYVKNFTDSWQDGRAFSGLVNVLQPNYIDLSTVVPEKAEDNINHALNSAETLFHFPKLLDARDVINTPDDLSIMTYVSYYKHYIATKGPAALHTYAEGPGLTVGESMTPATFKIISMTKDNERCTYGGANLFVRLLDARGEQACDVELKDHLNGTYDCLYEAPRAGKYKLEILIGKSNIKDSPFYPQIEPGEAEPGKCTAEGPGLTNAVAGEVATFKVFAKDSLDSQLRKGGSHFSAVLHDSTGDIPVDVVDNNDGTYDCSYIPKKAARGVNLVVSLSTRGYGEGNIAGSPFTVSVSPGHPSALNTICSGPGTLGALAGEVSPVLVETVDECGNRVTNGGAPLTGTLTFMGDGVDPLPVNVIDNGDGTYSLDYVPKKAGSYLLDVRLDDVPVKGSPFTILVGAGKYDPLNFEWEGIELDAEGRRVLVAGKTDLFIVKSKDTFGNPLEGGGLGVVGQLTGDSSVPVNVADKGDGTYDLSYTPFKAGPYQLSVTVGGVPVGGAPNPVSLLVVAAGPDASHSIAFGPGINTAAVGSSNSFTVEARDEFDNPLSFGGADVGGELTMDDGTEVPLEIVDNGDGTYSCSYDLVKKAGQYNLVPRLNGSPVKGAPFALNVLPGPFSLDSTEVEFPSEHFSSLLGPKIKVRDAELNLRAHGGDDAIAEILPLDDLLVPVTDNHDGSYNIQYPGHLRGQYEMNISVNGVSTPNVYSVDILPKPVEESVRMFVKQVLPETGDLLLTLLENATGDQSNAILATIHSLV
eukprot:TRINITY_DN5642_c0_g1_i5.p1 TRINITY_DN5642_c0_g1~~TRINITY_DN5642_c0_g1_i5.p1  ORF type:complete len:909 (-),score=226.19 TRINITY_DN5642_c0_g1_i5:318-3044(-)